MFLCGERVAERALRSPWQRVFLWCLCFCLGFSLAPRVMAAAPDPDATTDIHIDVTPAAVQKDPLPYVSAHAAVLIDTQTGDICYERQAHNLRPPASTTKIMTALLAVESSMMEDVVTVSAKAAAVGESSLYLEEGQKLLLRELVEGALVRSGNDACVAIAEQVAGSEENFVRAMNRKAFVLGALNTHFVNTNGLPNAAHLTTAYDLAIIARQAMRNPQFADYVKETSALVEYLEPSKKDEIQNTNKLLHMYPLADGIKTGTTNAAGKCLVASATQDGRRLICVVLDAPDRYGDCRRLLEWGFQSTERVDLGWRGDSITTQTIGGVEVPCLLTEDAAIILPKGAAERLQLVTQVVDVGTKVAKGEVVGTLSVRLDDREIRRIDLAAGGEVQAQPNRLQKTKERLDEFFQDLVNRLKG